MKVTPEQYAIAANNKISKGTVRKRLQQGWSIPDAITTPTQRQEMLTKKEQSLLKETPRGKTRSFALPVDFEEEYEEYLRQSGLTEKDFVAEIILKYFSQTP